MFHLNYQKIKYSIYIIVSFIIFYFGGSNYIFADFARLGQKGFQDPATPFMEGIIDLHNYIMFFLVIIFTFVSWILLMIWGRFYYLPFVDYKTGPKYFKLDEKAPSTVSGYFTDHFINGDLRRFKHASTLEIVWTILPTFVLILIASPSFILLYSMDEIYPDSLGITIKVIGHQWYWSYEIADITSGSFINNPLNYEVDSYMKQEEDLEIGELRLLEVDNSLVVPTHTVLRFIITSTDVLHSWAVPSLGIKVDAVPGRLNQTSAYIKREGTFYGQCSEICGVYHGFMPIKIESVDPNFAKLIKLA